MGFQTVVNAQPAIAVEGDFASQNPRHNTLAAAGQLVAPPGGLRVGYFFFINPATGLCSQSYGNGYTQISFLARNSQGLITQFLADSTQIVPEGFMVVGFDGGDFYARFASGITAGSTVYADETTGAPTNAATNTVTASAGFTGTASLATVGGQAQMTLATITGGIVTIGDTVAGTGTASNVVQSLASGTANTVGAVYNLSGAVTTEAAEAVTTLSTTMLATAQLTGGLNVGDAVSGTGVTAGTTITSVPAADAAVLLYGLSVAQHFASTTVSGPAAISSGFTATSNANQGELAVIHAAV
jgi:hypothetical protein